MIATYSEIWDNVTNAVSTRSIKMTIEGDDLIYIIPNDPLNKDWTQYQEWLAEGNKPVPATPPPPPAPSVQDKMDMLQATVETLRAELDKIKRNM